MNPIWRAIYKISPYFAVLPFNLNWIGVNWRPLDKFLRENPLHVVDVGARGGSLEELAPLKPYVSYIGFDADAEEVARLNSGDHYGFAQFRVLPFFIGSRQGAERFHLYRNPGESSLLEPNPEYACFMPNFSIERTVDVDSTTLDVLLQDGNLPDIDILKLDTQGTEYDILAHGQQALDKVFMVEVEVELVELYRNQKLFHHVCNLLYGRGFIVLYFNRVFLSRKMYKGPSRGQIIFGDALFGLSEQKAHSLSLKKKTKYIVTLINYGMLDFAYNLYFMDKKLKEHLPELERYFKQYGGVLSKVKRATLMQLDKVLAVLLYLRRTNQLRFDSDRSWPIR